MADIKQTNKQTNRQVNAFFHLQEESLDLVVKNLQVTYFATYGYRFPLTGKKPLFIHDDI